MPSAELHPVVFAYLGTQSTVLIHCQWMIQDNRSAFLDAHPPSYRQLQLRMHGVPAATRGAVSRAPVRSARAEAGAGGARALGVGGRRGVPVVLSWTSPDKSVGTGHSDMCGCKKCSHGARAKPKPKPPRVGPRGPRPKAGAKKKQGRGGGRRGVGWGDRGSGIWGLFRRRLAGG
jgi:hypothetical protein